MASQSIKFSALQLEDVPAAARMNADAFLVDRHTVMKNNWDGSRYDMYEMALESLPKNLKNPRLVIRKATDSETGELMGFCSWGFRGFEPEEMPELEGRIQPEEPQTPASTATSQETKEAAPKSEETPAEDGIQRLIAFTDKDIKSWMEEVMPPGTKCLFVVGLTVAPKFQGRGIGRKLLEWGLDVCDKHGVFAWVHSSEMAFQAYQKVGFKLVKEVDLDLDAYAPGPPIHEGPDAKWGHYIIRYMWYTPNSRS